MSTFPGFLFYENNFEKIVGGSEVCFPVPMEYWLHFHFSCLRLLFMNQPINNSD